MNDMDKVVDFIYDKEVRMNEVYAAPSRSGGGKTLRINRHSCQEAFDTYSSYVVEPCR